MWHMNDSSESKEGKESYLGVIKLHTTQGLCVIKNKTFPWDEISFLSCMGHTKKINALRMVTMPLKSFSLSYHMKTLSEIIHKRHKNVYF